MNEALELGGHPTKDAVIEETLREYMQHQKKLESLELFGTIEYKHYYSLRSGFVPT
ncbi:type II toxin-antitoxin system VapB family antitoxin [Nostoc sp. LEGE 12447]|uniref:type II toxin-antitoxin system VapB family antitoxin n=1 Tax=unclassified Nostoc TaxID=2593658 RepID=UPI002AD30BC1|nr:type II toxin-antitoxin system VapB family antitoxin [Nostoc sp. LEGE 12447]